MDGISMAYTWDAKPDDPTRHKVQYSAMKIQAPRQSSVPADKNSSAPMDTIHNTA
jgi:hypothetical protein